MKKIVKRNQVIITSLAILIAVAGYLNFADVDLGFKDKEASTDSASILDQVDYDITDESALLEENSQSSLTDTEEDTTTPGEAVLTGASGFAAQAKLSREQVRSQNKADLQEIINNDPEVSPYLKVVMVENYNVTKAEKLIPACDISEQISLASKEASGTGNMKFMLNGAVTLGTEDGANVEIHELVGNDNIFVFGASSDEVIEHYAKADYVAKDFYEKNPAIKAAIDFITSEEVLKVGEKENLERLQHEIISKDWFMTLLDFDSYKEKKEEALRAYVDQKTWAKKALVNIAKAGYFSSDRTIEEYNRDIWHL